MEARFAYQQVASHLRPLIRDRVAYHLVDDAAFRKQLADLSDEWKPPKGTTLQLVDMRLTDGDYKLQPQLDRLCTLCNEARLWDDNTLLPTVLSGGRYQVLGFRALVQLRPGGAGDADRGVDGGSVFRMLWQPEARRLVLNTMAMVVDPACRGNGCGRRMVGVLGAMLRREAARAAKMHGGVDDSLMLVDALEPGFYVRLGFEASPDATLVASEIRQWLTNEGTPKELRTVTLISIGSHCPKMIKRWAWQPVPKTLELGGSVCRRSGPDDDLPPTARDEDTVGTVESGVGETFGDVARRAGCEVYSLLSVNPAVTSLIDRRVVMKRRLKQGTTLKLPSEAFSAKPFHFEWVMCDTCDKWRHMRLRPVEFWDVQFRQTWSCGTRLGVDDDGESLATSVHPEACAVPQVTWNKAAANAAAADAAAAAFAALPPTMSPMAPMQQPTGLPPHHEPHKFCEGTRRPGSDGKLWQVAPYWPGYGLGGGTGTKAGKVQFQWVPVVENVDRRRGGGGGGGGGSARTAELADEPLLGAEVPAPGEGGDKPPPNFGADMEPMRTVSWSAKEDAWLRTLVLEAKAAAEERDEGGEEGGGFGMIDPGEWAVIAQRLSTGRGAHKVEARWSLIEQRDQVRKSATDGKKFNADRDALINAAAAAAAVDAATTRGRDGPAGSPSGVGPGFSTAAAARPGTKGGQKFQHVHVKGQGLGAADGKKKAKSRSGPSGVRKSKK